jgi:hypothetical protein
MPLTQNSVTMPARWAVVWVSKGRRIVKETDDDFGEAIRLFTLLVKNGRRPEIRCVNVGFQPPKRITQYKRYKTIVVEVNGKMKKRRTLSVVNLMQDYNQKGVWWCPYCIKLRRFKMQTVGLRDLYVCPVCGITSRDGYVVRFNPYALVVEVHRRSYGRRRRSRRRS